MQTLPWVWIEANRDPSEEGCKYLTRATFTAAPYTERVFIPEVVTFRPSVGIHLVLSLWGRWYI